MLVLLGLRLTFETSDANRTGFVDFILRITGPLVQPFEGIADPRTLDGGGVFYPETVIAMGVYLVATTIVLMALSWLAASVSRADEGPVVHQDRLVRGH